MSFADRSPSKEETLFLPPPTPPQPQETGLWGQNPGAPHWEEPPPMGLRRGGLPTVGMSPQKPPGESAVASLWVENPKVAPARGRRRGREAGLGPSLGGFPGLGRPCSPRHLPWREEGSLTPRGLPWVWWPRSPRRLRASKAGCRSGAPPARGGVVSASFPVPPPPAPPPLGIFGTFLSCSNFPAPYPARPSPAPDLALHRISPATPARVAGGDPTPLRTWGPLPRTLVPPICLSLPPPLLQTQGGRLKLWETESGRSRQTEPGLAQSHGELLRPSESLRLAPQPAGCPRECLPGGLSLLLPFHLYRLTVFQPACQPVCKLLPVGALLWT